MSTNYIDCFTEIENKFTSVYPLNELIPHCDCNSPVHNVPFSLCVADKAKIAVLEAL